MFNKPIYAISSSETQINRILQNLCGPGPSSCDISVLPHSTTPDRRFGVEGGEGKSGFAIAGALSCALLSAGLGLLAGLGASTVPTLISVVAAGSCLGALVGSLLGNSMWIMFPHHAAESFKARIPEGSYLISIRVSGRRDESRVKRILNDLGVKSLAPTSGKSGTPSFSLRALKSPRVAAGLSRN